ncbi:cell division protein FtsQ/DivIB [Sulfurisoma sediminicola]|uniref:Cell division protein FtsQ n=1 Tax=Sulfurisoma sediminicola TaxID=1381557 RepID=A0A497XMS9_9PROT|nr:cell division protein FtsQ/DivIB [Sulfurisoma sediminicola]RLJ67758.1 cell division protein FtsQ [Sulfurisoma sediminicola]
MARVERNRRTQGGEGFWNQPQWLDLAADLLIAVAVAGLAWAAMSAVKRLPIYPLRELVVVGTVERVSRAQIEHAARTALSGNLFAVNLDDARLTFEKLPWVRSASLRRQWPDALELALEEHVAVARWSPADGEQRLVNTHGEVFAASAGDELPAFSGPEGSSAAMLARYHEFDSHLAKIQRKTVALTLTAREAWQVRLDDGVLVDLGRDQPKQPLVERLTRLTDHYVAAREKVHAPIAAVDVRYPNGFALRLGQPDRKSAS